MQNTGAEPNGSAIPVEADIAIVGMAGVFPGAGDLQTFWENIVSKFDAVSDAPESWEGLAYYDPDSSADDRIYCKRGGFLRDVYFNPPDYGVMPCSVDGADPDHFIGLMVAARALADAGYADGEFAHDRTQVIVGRGTYINRAFTNQLQHCLVIDQTLRILKELHPEHSEPELAEIKQQLKKCLAPFNSEVAPGLVPNVMTGRIANRLDLMGANYTVDAACASSLVSTELAMQALRFKQCDMALAGGANVASAAPTYMLFCRLDALSRKGQIRPFDRDADGTLLGEGFGMLVLKRRTDAEHDGDRIYALVKSIGIASDGRGRALLAPRVEGEESAIRRAYEQSGISPQSIGLVEAHGTATPVGDDVEIEALSRVFGTRTSGRPSCALGTVKSMIGHLIPAAGIAALIKTALALYHKTLPATLHCENPNARLKNTPFYVNTTTRPWIHGSSTPRRAGVNAFGFGGINAHAILEEYCPHER